MPRIQAGKNAEDKKDQILYMKDHTLGSESDFEKLINKALAKGRNLAFGPYGWSDDDIHFFYDKILTDADIKKYDDAIKLDKQKMSDQDRKNKKYESVKPTHERFGMKKKKDEINNMNISEEEKEEKLKELEEEFEFRSLECRHKVLQNLSSEERDRMIDLEEKLMPKFYDEKTHELEMLQKESDELSTKISKATHKSVNPFQRLWNGIQRLWNDKDIEAIAKNKEYKELLERKTVVDNKCSEIDGWRMNMRELFKSSFDERDKKNEGKKYTNTYELAKAIVEMTLRQDDPDKILEPSLVDSSAVNLMKSEFFKYTVEKMIVDDTGVEAKKFYGAMMKNMENNVLDAAPEKAVENVSDKTKDVVNEKADENLTRSKSVDINENLNIDKFVNSL